MAAVLGVSPAWLLSGEGPDAIPATAVPDPASPDDRRPNRRHTAIHAFLGRLETAQAAGTSEVEIPDGRGATIRLTITPREEESLRTVGFSGPAVTTERQVLELILLWRDWELQEEEQARRR